MLELLEDDDAVEMMREDIILLLSRDPHCEIANLIGQALSEIA